MKMNKKRITSEQHDSIRLETRGYKATHSIAQQGINDYISLHHSRYDRVHDVHVVQRNTHSSLVLILLLSTGTRHTIIDIAYSLHTPVRVCSPAIEAAIAMHASPSFCIAVSASYVGDGANLDGVIVG